MVKSINKYSLEQDVSVLKSTMLTYTYGPMYLQLDEYAPCYDKKPDISETHINRHLICDHIYTDDVAQNESIEISRSNKNNCLSQDNDL